MEKRVLHSRFLTISLVTALIFSLSVPITALLTDDTGETVSVLAEENSAPMAENMELSTYKNVAITERFPATDPEGDLLTYQLVKKSARGSVTFTDDGSGQFVYTPYENKTGKDSFTYIAIDAVGNRSNEATVKIKIEKPCTKITYADMDGVPSYKAALRLAGEGVFVGASMGGTYYFEPDTPVSRSEFLTMVMDLTDMQPLEDITTTGFSDDLSIPVWAKGYVSSALKTGLIQGSLADDGQIVWNGDSNITRAEASVLLNGALQIADVSDNGQYSDSTLAPVWAYQAAVNLETVGVIETDNSGALALSSQLTRGEVAEMLSAALDVMETRESSSWFIW